MRKLHTKMPFHIAKHEALIVHDAMCELTERWEFAGSLRRECNECSDIEHVIIPKMGQIQKPDQMFAVPCFNLLFDRLDELVEAGAISKATYGESQVTRWGEKSRSFLCGAGYRHEVYSATPDNWGVVMAIRTGPWQLSKHLVTEIKKRNHTVKDGSQVFPIGRDEPISVKTEKEFFELCGVPFREPKERVW